MPDDLDQLSSPLNAQDYIPTLVMFEEAGIWFGTLAIEGQMTLSIYSLMFGHAKTRRTW
jgi:hypothetical protein